MSIFWQSRRGYYGQNPEERWAFDYEDWVTGTWRQVSLPLDRRQLPVLPGLYSLYGRFNSRHLELPIVYRQKQLLVIREALPNWMTGVEKHYGFNAFIYVGSSRVLYSRWESHEKMRDIEQFIENGIGVNFYFYALPLTETFPRESETERSTRYQLERKLIWYLCPILNSPRFWGRGAKH